MIRLVRRATWRLVVLAWIVPVFGADGAKSWASFGLVGSVRTLTESDLADNISSAEPKGTPFHTRTTYFSPDGSALFFEDCVSTCERIDFVWQAGRLVEERHQSENQLPERTVKYVRDSDGRVVEEQTETGGILECTKRYRRDASQEEESEYCGDSLTSRRAWEHDEAAGKDQVSWYTYSGEKGDEVLETRYEERRVRLDDGTVRTEQLFGGGSTAVTTADSKGRILEEVRDSNAGYHRETHRFDESGREIEKAEWARDGTNINRRTYVYVNDAQGNWIRRTELFGSPAYSAPVEGEVTVRKIDYY